MEQNPTQSSNPSPEQHQAVPSRPRKPTDGDNYLRMTAAWITISLTSLFVLFLLWRIGKVTIEQRIWIPIVQSQFPAVIGLPTAAAAALFIVLSLRVASGPIEVELPNLKLKGAAAPIIFWIVCYSVIVTSIKLLWLPK
jgi:hypothetical protein